MRKVVVFLLVFATVFLLFSCKQEINCKLDIPSWVRGKWDVNATASVTGSGSFTVIGTYTVTSNNVYGTVTYVETSTVTAVDLAADFEGHKDLIEEFSQSSSSTEYSITYTAKSGSDKVKQIIKFKKNGLMLDYYEFIYVNGYSYELWRVLSQKSSASFSPKQRRSVHFVQPTRLWLTTSQTSS